MAGAECEIHPWGEIINPAKQRRDIRIFSSCQDRRICINIPQERVTELAIVVVSGSLYFQGKTVAESIPHPQLQQIERVVWQWSFCKSEIPTHK